MAVYPLIFGLGGWEILLIVLVILMFVGGSKIPELMKGLGKGVKSFKEGMKDGDKTDGQQGNRRNEPVYWQTGKVSKVNPKSGRVVSESSGK